MLAPVLVMGIRVAKVPLVQEVFSHLESKTSWSCALGLRLVLPQWESAR